MHASVSQWGLQSQVPQGCRKQAVLNRHRTPLPPRLYTQAKYREVGKHTRLPVYPRKGPNYTSLHFCVGDTLQDPQWMPETIDSTEPYTVFSIHTYL